ncbi:hypothetical protein DCO58_01865 [Helicobacter saguini]|uniref:Uncharacterized protein n=1 Tax=Helicobacter saguini TaxID=1548018 RepID=A0A347W075_9HELI|nr:hypothetical protein [Helicobacter saguini]MWV62873.1 hypothetical protein [Helicobacter saguini]MWV66457.1 hypothetical protein [Helicobacter saguini]MWV68806.1 hypothetical protein [Helicobacter saguini]MWV71639.1 hypothetical protein [Helicobacter saguini]TLD94442.1 hypothetical protein LS64_005805 [Helicobacter saguini]
MDFWAGYINSLNVANDSYMLDSSKKVNVELDSTNLKELLESAESAFNDFANEAFKQNAKKDLKNILKGSKD